MSEGLRMGQAFEERAAYLLRAVEEEADVQTVTIEYLEYCALANL